MTPRWKQMAAYIEMNRGFIERSILAVVLPAVSGAVNASGFFAVGSYTSHVTGNVARIGDELAQGNRAAAWFCTLLVLTFFIGAMTATVLIERAKRLAKARYLSSLLLEAGALAVFAVFTALLPESLRLHNLALTAVLCFAMGLQNALVTKISGAVVRTTHLTGVLTDLGIETVRVSLWLRENARGKSIWERFKLLARLRHENEFKRVRVHMAVFSSFLVGAVTGPLLFLRYGALSLGLPIVVVLVLGAFDILMGISHTPHGQDLHGVL